MYKSAFFSSLPDSGLLIFLLCLSGRGCSTGAVKFCSLELLMLMFRFFFFLLLFFRYQLCSWILTECVCGVGGMEYEGLVKVYCLLPTEELCGYFLPTGMLVLDEG